MPKEKKASIAQSEKTTPTLSDHLEEILIDDQIPKLLALYHTPEPYPGSNPTPSKLLAWAMMKGIIDMSRFNDMSKAQRLTTVRT